MPLMMAKRACQSSSMLFVSSNKMKLRLLLGMYSYINMFSSPSTQHPSSLTKFLCCSLAIKITSFFSSSTPCADVFDKRFTAISSPFSSVPCIIYFTYIELVNKTCIHTIKLVTFDHLVLLYLTLYTDPNPPSPSLLSVEK